MNARQALDHIKQIDARCPACGGDELRVFDTTLGAAIECLDCGGVCSPACVHPSPILPRKAAPRARAPREAIHDYPGSCGCEDYPCCGH